MPQWIFATGSEVIIAAEAGNFWPPASVVRVVSVPCSNCCLPPEAKRGGRQQAWVNVAVEAGVRQGWDAIIGAHGAFVGMTSFGASAPYKLTYRLPLNHGGKGGAETALSDENRRFVTT